MTKQKRTSILQSCNAFFDGIRLSLRDFFVSYSLNCGLNWSNSYIDFLVSVYSLKINNLILEHMLSDFKDSLCIN